MMKLSLKQLQCNKHWSRVTLSIMDPMLQIHPIYPRKTGYEGYGEVIQVGNKVRRNLNIGDKVFLLWT